MGRTMENSRSVGNGMALITVKTLVLAMFVVTTGYAQDRDYNNNLILEEIQASEVTADGLKQGVMQLSGSYEIRRPIGEIYNRISWPNPLINFNSYGINYPAGDLNGDGNSDVIRQFGFRPDPRDNDPATFAGRTLVFLSGMSLLESDHILFDAAFPAGDLNGDGKSNLISGDIFGSPSMYSFGESGVESAPLALSHEFHGTTSQIYTSLIGTDLDGNGYDDMLFLTPSSIQGKTFFVLFGASDESGFELRSYAFSDFMPEGSPVLAPAPLNFIDMFTYNGQAYVVLVATQPNPRTRYAVIITIDGNRDASLVQYIPFANSSGFNTVRAFSAVLEAGNAPSLVMVNSDFAAEKSIYYPLNTDHGKLFADEPLPLHPEEVWPAGNLTDEGMVFVTREFQDSRFRLAVYRSEIPGQLFLSDELPYDSGNVYDFSAYTNTGASNRRYGDITGNGRNDHILMYSSSDNFESGFLVISNAAEDLFEFRSEAIDANQYSRIGAQEVFALGDVTGNGADDFAVYYTNNPLSNTLVFFEGGSNWQTPARIWDLTTDIIVRDVIAGNFLDMNRRDIVVMTNERLEPGSNQFESVVSVYQGGGFPDRVPIRSVRKEDVYPGITLTTSNVLATMANAGDVNNSGLDDLLIANGANQDPVLGMLPATLYLGGPGFLNGAPDVSISFPAQDLGGGIGGTLAGLGDINGDGIDDFAIVNIFQGQVTDRAYGFGGGRINVFFGRDGDANFGQPDLTLRPDTASMTAGYETRFLGMSEIATGDFNGDGYRGIAANTFTHRVISNPDEGVPGVHIFNRPMSRNQPDQLLPLHTSIMSITASDFPFLPFNGRMNMTGIPDLTSNGRDELLMYGGSNSINAVLHYGRDRMNDIPDVVFEAPNRSVGFGFFGNFTNRQFRSAVGDFNGDGKLNLLVVQPGDGNYRDTPVYMYELGRPGGVQVKIAKTEPIGSTGGTVVDEETGSKVVIPAGATENEVEIEVGTFTVVPEGATVSGAMIYLGPPGTTFSEPVQITVRYDPDNLPPGVQNEEDLVLLRFDEATSEWEELLPSEVNTVDKTVTGFTTRFSGFGAGAIKAAVNIDRDETQIPGRVELYQNYPNPFNPLTVIGFTLPADGEVRLEVFNILGERVAVLADERRPAGTHQVSFNASRLSSGVYLYRLTTGDRVQTRKMVLIK
ncbi:MAG: T9SS C-terminal target domain-containing protein [Balneolaceae bacterium]|nr:MAG: T9SS C-terminal target domain-containing protein [Balneolaceae bacterium]